MRHFLFFVCLFLNAKTFALTVDDVSRQIAGKIAYCHTTPQTDNPEHQNQFYSHVAEQHLGIGINSYARYPDPTASIMTKLLRSEFELDVSVVSPQFQSLRNLVKQGARCLWCLDILDAFIKPLIMPVKPKIAPIPKTIGSLLTIVTGLENAISNGKSLADADSILQRQSMQVKIVKVQDVITNLESLKAEITYYLPIIKTLLNCGDNF